MRKKVLPGHCARSHDPGGNPEANLKSISHRCNPVLVECVWELTRETINLHPGCLHGGEPPKLGM